MSGTRNLEEPKPYSIIFPFEADFDPIGKRQWMLENRHQSFYLAGVYVLLVFGLREFMKNRPRIELKRIIIPWNILLATFSTIGFCRTFPELLHQLNTFGFTHSVCHPSFIAHNKVTAFWVWAFILSKAPELGDTLFVVFRKHKLIFLHWFHHIVTLLFFWFAYSEHATVLLWFMVVNLFVHSLMYSYYALRAMGIQVPKFIAICITSLQIIQMVIGYCVSCTVFVELSNSRFCQVPEYIAFFALFIFTALFILFMWFFYKTYLSPNTNLKSE